MPFHFKPGTIPLDILASVSVTGLLVFMVVFYIDRSYALKKARDLVRMNQVQVILGAVQGYQVDHKGDLPAEIDKEDETWQMIGLPGVPCQYFCPNKTVKTECIDLTELNPVYLSSIPQDSAFTDFGTSGYYINKKDQGGLTVGSCLSEYLTEIEKTQ